MAYILSDKSNAIIETSGNKLNKLQNRTKQDCNQQKPVSMYKIRSLLLSSEY